MIRFIRAYGTQRQAVRTGQWQESEAAYDRKSSPFKTRLYALYPMATYIVPKYSAGSAAFVIEDSDESDPGQ